MTTNTFELLFANFRMLLTPENDFKTNGSQTELNSKRTELITIVGHVCKVLEKNKLKSIGKLWLTSSSAAEDKYEVLFDEDEE